MTEGNVVFEPEDVSTEALASAWAKAISPM